MAETLRTVLADDVQELRTLLRLVLEMSDEFVVVGEARNGEEAVALAARHRPDLMLLDVSMPVKDGLEALPEIRWVSPATTIVMLSGFEAERLGPAALAGGASAYLEKGLTPTQLLERLRDIVTLRDAAGPESA